MKDKIIQIMLKWIIVPYVKGKDYPTAINGIPQSAEEIESLIKENYVEKGFVKWIFSECPFIIGENANRKIIAWRHKTNEQLTLDELYQYWKRTIKNK